MRTVCVASYPEWTAPIPDQISQYHTVRALALPRSLHCRLQAAALRNLLCAARHLLCPVDPQTQNTAAPPATAAHLAPCVQIGASGTWHTPGSRHGGIFPFPCPLKLNSSRFPSFPLALLFGKASSFLFVILHHQSSLALTLPIPPASRSTADAHMSPLTRNHGVLHY